MCTAEEISAPGGMGGSRWEGMGCLGRGGVARMERTGRDGTRWRRIGRDRDGMYGSSWVEVGGWRRTRRDETGWGGAGRRYGVGLGWVRRVGLAGWQRMGGLEGGLGWDRARWHRMEGQRWDRMRGTGSYRMGVCGAGQGWWDRGNGQAGTDDGGRERRGWEGLDWTAGNGVEGNDLDWMGQIG